MSNEMKQVSFAVNEYDWILLWEKLGTVVMRATTIKYTKNKKLSDEVSQHRCDEAEAKGGVRVRSKLYDTSKFFSQPQGL